MSTETTGKSLAEMTAEVVANNEAHGWYENCATFPEAMAMLHSEVSEALEAWRKWGVEDVTRNCCDGDPECIHNKPEGVGSEFADVFIRLLDDAWLFGQHDLEHAARRIAPVGVPERFPAAMNVLHDLISAASRDITGWGFEENGAAILVYLRELCEEYGFDLAAEFERKMTYNRSRPYRHGGKRI